uniref:Uncharacterized protein n=1 Tax=uncultured prokaryote TaxID=198431 RepID=A0A0H5Q357_9ZZZZ|nr:hypothetical protein [uncultured prokaryote]
MPINSLYPGFVKLFYNSNGHQHTQTLPVKPFVGVGGAWFLEAKNIVNNDVWQDMVTAYVDVFKTWLPNTGSITRAELWTMASPTATPVFADALPLSVAGTVAITPVALGQTSVTYRSATGGLYRWIGLEGSDAANAEAYPPFGGIHGALATYLTGATSFVVARDGGTLTAPIRLLSKTNDKLREKYLLDA